MTPAEDESYAAGERDAEEISDLKAQISFEIFDEEDRMTEAQKAVEEFNALYPIGTEVDYYSCTADKKAGKPSLRSRTRSPAQVLSGHTAVVWLNNKGGCVAISHVVPVVANLASVPADKVVVHLLHAGRPVCDFSRQLPKDWPDGHIWVGVSGASQVSCQRCLRLGLSLIEEHLALYGNPRAKPPEGVIQARGIVKE